MKALKYIAKIQTDFPAKFGIPRQSGLVNTKGTIVFEPEYRKEEALKGLEDYSHLWLIWEFSEAVRTGCIHFNLSGVPSDHGNPGYGL